MFRKVKTILQRRGISYLWYVVQQVFLPKLAFNLMHTQNKGVLRKAGAAMNWLLLHVQRPMSLSQLGIIARQLAQENASICEQSITRWSMLPVAESTRRSIETARAISNARELVIGQIDQDGRLLGKYGELPGLEVITKTDFLPRNKYTIDIVLIDDFVLVRKNFGTHTVQFMHEWAALALLSGNANVPTLYKVDEQKCQIYMNFVVGLTMRDVLAQASVVIRDEQTKHDRTLQKLSAAKRAQTIRARAAEQIPHYFSTEFLQAIDQQLEIIHAAGIVNLDIKVGNIIVAADKQPHFIDFENAQIFKSTESLAYQLKCDSDRERYNRAFGRTLLTDARARTALTKELNKEPKWYAPIDFGYGLTVGGYWATDSGSGRWDYFNKAVMQPYIENKRVLDLGSNNGVMPLMMLRDGAQEVMGLELEIVNVGRAKLVHEIFEWRDRCKYHFYIHNRNIHDIVEWDIGNFDVVTALCSLYYLSVDEMAAVVQKVAQIAPVMIIQANITSDQESTKREKASVAFLQELLEQAGFDRIEVIAPPNFSRPLLIGQQSFLLRN